MVYALQQRIYMKKFFITLLISGLVLNQSNLYAKNSFYNVNAKNVFYGCSIILGTYCVYKYLNEINSSSTNNDYTKEYIYEPSKNTSTDQQKISPSCEQANHFLNFDSVNKGIYPGVSTPTESPEFISPESQGEDNFANNQSNDSRSKKSKTYQSKHQTLAGSKHKPRSNKK